MEKLIYLQLKRFLYENPKLADDILNHNQRYIFFNIDKKTLKKAQLVQ